MTTYLDSFFLYFVSAGTAFNMLTQMFGQIWVVGHILKHPNLVGQVGLKLKHKFSVTGRMFTYVRKVVSRSINMTATLRDQGNGFNFYS